MLVASITAMAVRCAAQETLNLWPGEQPPGFVANNQEETISERGRIDNVKTPTITVFPPTDGVNTGLALIVCPGGSYTHLGWNTGVVDTARYFNQLGITVIGLKYRVRPLYKITPTDRSLPLQDAKRAVQLVRSHAAEWGIDPHKIGVMGISAGSNLTMTLADEYDTGDAASADPIARFSNRPDFVVAGALWHWKQTESPFKFDADTPPAFLVHATNDPVAPVELAYAVRDQLKSVGVPVHLDLYDHGRHGVAQLTARRLQQKDPTTEWPEHLLAWLEKNGITD